MWYWIGWFVIGLITAILTFKFTADHIFKKYIDGRDLFMMFIITILGPIFTICILSYGLFSADELFRNPFYKR